jgi:hypothetical protein
MIQAGQDVETVPRGNAYAESIAPRRALIEEKLPFCTITEAVAAIPPAPPLTPGIPPLFAAMKILPLLLAFTLPLSAAERAALLISIKRPDSIRSRRQWRT